MTSIKFLRSSTNPVAETLNFGEPCWTSISGTNTLYIGDSGNLPVAVSGSGSSYTFSNGLLNTSGTITVKPDITTGVNNFGVTSVSNGTSVKIDNSSIIPNGSSQLSIGLVDAGTF